MSSSNLTTFKALRTSEHDPEINPDSSNNCITEPILASFPSNLPSEKALSKMHFNVYQLEKNIAKKKSVRRVIKAQFKGINYEAKSYSADMGDKDQASDYYVSVFDSKDNKAYTIPIKAAYQFQ